MLKRKSWGRKSTSYSLRGLLLLGNQIWIGKYDIDSGSSQPVVTSLNRCLVRGNADCLVIIYRGKEKERSVRSPLAHLSSDET